VYNIDNIELGPYEIYALQGDAYTRRPCKRP
jgi:hypothetical protein